MSTQNAIEIITVTFAAGESKTFNISGDYFEIFDAVNPVDVLLSDASGAQRARMAQALASFYTKVSFNVIQITSATAQTIRIAFGSGEIGSRRSTGSVSIAGGNVGVSGTVSLAAGTSVAIAGTPTVSLAAGTSVGVYGSVGIDPTTLVKLDPATKIYVNKNSYINVVDENVEMVINGDVATFSASYQNNIGVNPLVVYKLLNPFNRSTPILIKEVSFYCDSILNVDLCIGFDQIIPANQSPTFANGGGTNQEMNIQADWSFSRLLKYHPLSSCMYPETL